MLYTDDTYIQKTLFKRNKNTHKGNYGRVLIFAGSAGMAGAATFAGQAAIRSGAGLVSYLLPDLSDPIYPILQIASPECTCVEYSESFDLSKYDVIAAGPGLGASDDRLFILSTIIENYDGILVLDADALNAVSKYPALADSLAESSAKVIITPHPGEADRLLKLDPDLENIRLSEDRAAKVKELANMFNCTAVLKGSSSLVCGNTALTAFSTPVYDVFENITGNPGMATAGSGDVLAGLIASLAAQGYEPLDAARIGVYIHGAAGDKAAKLIGEMGMTASSILGFVPLVLNDYYKELS